MVVYRLPFNQCVLLASNVIVACSESSHSAIGPRETDPKRAFLRSSCAVFTFFSFIACLLPKEKLIFFSSKRMNAVRSSLESIPIKFFVAKSGYATVLAIFYLIILIVPILCSRCARCLMLLYSGCFNLNFLLCLFFNHVILLLRFAISQSFAYSHTQNCFTQIGSVPSGKIQFLCIGVSLLLWKKNF